MASISKIAEDFFDACETGKGWAVCSQFCTPTAGFSAQASPLGPVPPTGKRMSTDYVYVMQFQGDKIAYMTKIWNAELALKEIGWA
jgi:hypothetical protein